MPTSEFTAGTQIADYRLEECLGRGSTSSIYAAYDLRLERRVALKLCTAVVHDAQARLRFEREAASMAALAHDGLLRIYASGQHAATPWIAMELVDGLALDRVLDGLRAGASRVDAVLRAAESAPQATPSLPSLQLPAGRLDPLELRRRVEILRDLALALEHLHRRGFLHCDVKPSNILLRRDGSVVLADFGLTRSLQQTSQLSGTAFWGTPNYASPEQLAGRAAELGPRSDVFALGATMYELLTLERAFQGKSVLATLEEIERSSPKDPGRLVRGLPRELSTIVQSALAKEPSARYASAQAVAEDLQAFLEFRPIAAQRVGPVKRLWSWGRREPLRATLTVAASLAALAVVSLLAYGLAQRPLVAAAKAAERSKAATQQIVRGYLAFDLGLFASARTALREALLLQPARIEAEIGLALCARALHGKQAEIDSLEAALEKQPQARSLRRLLGATLMMSQDRQAQQRGTALLEELGSAREGHEFLVQALLAFGSNAGKPARVFYRDLERMLRSAVLASRRPDPVIYALLCNSVADHLSKTKAQQLASIVLELWPRTVLGNYLAASALHGHDARRAEQFYRLAMDDEPALAELLRPRLAEIHARRGDYDACRRELSLSFESHPDSSYAQSVRAECALAEGKLDECYAAYDQAASLRPRADLRLAQWAARIVQIGRKTKTRQRCRKSLTTWLQRFPASGQVAQWLITLALELGDLPFADRKSAEWLSTHRDVGSTYALRAQVLRKMDKLDEAIEAMQKALELDEGHPIASYNLASFQLQAARLQEALATCRDLVRRERYRNPRSLCLLATILLRSEDLAEAGRIARMGLELAELREQTDHAIQVRLRSVLRAVRRKQREAR